MSPLMDVYIRVSRLGKRAKDDPAYRSPTIQRETIHAWLRTNGYLN